ncbi:MAG: cytochrome c3 family protein [Proteobacteria bacterium]|nr:cytochrome c3 family protein [Pseudomonadota bacterium]
MGKFSQIFITVVVFVIGYTIFCGNAVSAIPSAIVSCKICHADFTSLLPHDHPEIENNELPACRECHQPGRSYKNTINEFSTRIHMAHLPPRGTVDCLTCHSWSAGRSFGLLGTAETWGTPTQEDLDFLREIFSSWATSEYMDNKHAKASVSCANCHGPELPAFDATLENEKCLQCHGPMDILAQKTEPAEFKDRNPHKSHLGEIHCTVCHKAHSESNVYCLGCHLQFKMSLPGGGKKTQ